MENKTLYALRSKSTGELVKYSESYWSNEDGNGTDVEISFYGDKVWTTERLWHAEYVRNTSEDFYMSTSVDKPKHCSDIKSDDLEIVKYKVVVETVPITKEEMELVPTNKDVVDYRKNKYDEGHKRQIEYMIDEGILDTSTKILGGKGSDYFNIFELMSEWRNKDIKTDFTKKLKSAKMQK